MERKVGKVGETNTICLYIWREKNGGEMTVLCWMKKNIKYLKKKEDFKGETNVIKFRKDKKERIKLKMRRRRES